MVWQNWFTKQIHFWFVSLEQSGATNMSHTTEHRYGGNNFIYDVYVKIRIDINIVDTCSWCFNWPNSEGMLETWIFDGTTVFYRLLSGHSCLYLNFYGALFCHRVSKCKPTQYVSLVLNFLCFRVRISLFFSSTLLGGVAKDSRAATDGAGESGYTHRLNEFIIVSKWIFMKERKWNEMKQKGNSWRSCKEIRFDYMSSTKYKLLNSWSCSSPSCYYKNERTMKTHV